MGDDQLTLFCWFLAAQENHKLNLEAETGWVHRLRYSGNHLCTVGKWRDSAGHVTDRDTSVVGRSCD